MNRFGTAIRWLLVLWIILGVSRTLPAAADEEDDEGILREAGLSSDGPALLAALSKHTLTADKRRQVETLIRQLGNDEFTVREAATRHLRAFGRLVLPRLRDASKDRDAERARRAKMLIEDVDTGPDTRLMGACRTRQGEIVCACRTQCLFLDHTGKQLRSFAVKYNLNFVGCIDVLPNGRILLASFHWGKVMEYDNQGKLLHEWTVPAVTAATGLPNGHILAYDHPNARGVELDRDGKVVWEHKIERAYRARRR